MFDGIQKKKKKIGIFIRNISRLYVPWNDLTAFYVSHDKNHHLSYK